MKRSTLLQLRDTMTKVTKRAPDIHSCVCGRSIIWFTAHFLWYTKRAMKYTSTDSILIHLLSFARPHCFTIRNAKLLSFKPGVEKYWYLILSRHILVYVSDSRDISKGIRGGIAKSHHSGIRSFISQSRAWARGQNKCEVCQDKLARASESSCCARTKFAGKYTYPVMLSNT